MSASPIDAVLAQLNKVRQRQSGQWSACCPAHDDKSPSLSVRETAEGSVLLHCFSGCSVADIVSALGLDMAVLFPPRQLSGREPKRTPSLLTSKQALELLDREALFLAVVAANILRGVEINQNDLDRITKSAGRINWLRNESTGGAYA